MSLWRRIFGFGSGSGLAIAPGPQGSGLTLPGHTSEVVGTDAALALSGVWASTVILADTISTLPLFLYKKDSDGQHQLARSHRLWRVLHDRPNSYMTTPVALTAMVVNYALRNNAYAKILRNAAGDSVGFLPLPTEQVRKQLLPDGGVVYECMHADGVDVIADANMIHWQGIGNGLIGLDTLHYASRAFGLAAKVEASASDVFDNAGKMHGVLTIDGVLDDKQRAALRQKFAGLQMADRGRTIPVLEAGMKFQSIQMTAEQAQLGEARRYSVEDVARIMGVPSVLINDVTKNSSWGSGIAEIKEGFATFKLRPMCKRLEAELTEKLLSPVERQNHTVEFNFDGLLRASPEKRAALYKDGVQSGQITPNEVRQLEGRPPQAGGDQLYMQAQMVPINLLGKQPAPVTKEA